MKRIRALVITAIFMAPGTALAHSPVKGIGNFYNGILHPALVPAHLIAIIALGLLMGRQKQAIYERGILVFLGAGGIGLLAVALGAAVPMEKVLLVGAALLGILVAVSLPLSTWALVLAAAFCGLMIGLDSIPEDLYGKNRIMSLLGTFLGLGISIFYLTLLGSKATRQWQQTGVRIIGSWTAASAILVFALSFVQIDAQPKPSDGKQTNTLEDTSSD